MAEFPGAAAEPNGSGLVPLSEGWGEGWWEEEPPLFGVFLTTESLMLENTSKIESDLGVKASTPRDGGSWEQGMLPVQARLMGTATAECAQQLLPKLHSHPTLSLLLLIPVASLKSTDGKSSWLNEPEQMIDGIN